MHPKPALRREISLWQATLAGVGIILGAGIYVLVGKAATLSGNAVWLSFLISALVSIFTGLSYAELSSVFPKAGAEYVYTKHAFGRRLAFIIGWLLIISGFVFSATVSFGFAGYFERLFGVPYLLTAAVLIAAMSFLVFYGIKESVWFAIVSTIIEVSGLVIIIAIGMPYLGSVNYFEFPSLAGVFSAAALIFFAYIGFEQVTRLSEETKNPEKNIPRALLLSIAITTILYILVALSAVSVIDWQTLGMSKAPLADVALKVLGPEASTILSVIALFATSNTVMLMLLATSRMIYGIGRSFSRSNPISRIHSKRRTPWVATIITGVCTMAFLSLGSIDVVAGVTDFLVFFTFVIINAAAIKMRYVLVRRPMGHFRMPLNIGRFPVIPVLGIISCLMLMAYVNFDIMLYSAGMIILGFIIAEILEKKGVRAEFE
jgi:APA family basic amino acid/polyamine antiporter